MLILAIDTALDVCSVALLDTDTGMVPGRASVPMKRGHAEALMPMIAQVMKAAGLPFTALDRIAVTTGPGSFTGLRVGLSAARGLGLAANKPVAGVTTLSAYAAPVISEDTGHPVISVIDARHDQVYFQIVGGDGYELVAPQVAPIDAVLAIAEHLGAVHLVGNAAGMLAARWPDQTAAPVAVDPQAAPDITWVAWLGAAAEPGLAPPRPFYLRAPDVQVPANMPQSAVS